MVVLRVRRQAQDLRYLDAREKSRCSIDPLRGCWAGGLTIVGLCELLPMAGGEAVKRRWVDGELLPAEGDGAVAGEVEWPSIGVAGDAASGSISLSLTYAGGSSG